MNENGTVNLKIYFQKSNLYVKNFLALFSGKYT